MAKWPYNTATWQRLRLRKLYVHSLCHACRLRGHLTPANTVDHVKAIADGGAPFPDLDGLMSLCARCHNDKTNAVDRPDRAATGRRFKGFDTQGNPIDPDDAWHGVAASKDGKQGGNRTGAGTGIDILSGRLGKWD